jgi:hypothetical protein
MWLLSRALNVMEQLSDLFSQSIETMLWCIWDSTSYCQVTDFCVVMKRPTGDLPRPVGSVSHWWVTVLCAVMKRPTGELPRPVGIVSHWWVTVPCAVMKRPTDEFPRPVGIVSCWWVTVLCAVMEWSTDEFPQPTDNMTQRWSLFCRYRATEGPIGSVPNFLALCPVFVNKATS